MQQRHIDRYSYFNELAITSREFYIDYLEKFVAIKRGMNILEIGCGEGGNLLPFAEKECNVTGIDRSEERISQAISYFKLLGFNGRFIYSDFFDFSSEEDMNKYDTFQKKIMALRDRDLSTLAEIIYGSCDIKRQVVENDPKEQGERALLNFGHTLGHAIEKLKNFELLHGECVAIGMVAASYLSYLRNMITEAQYRTICEMSQQMQLPTTVEGLTKEDIIRVSKNDINLTAGQSRFFLFEGLGNAVMTDYVSYE